jgi:hypothetical protein
MPKTQQVELEEMIGPGEPERAAGAMVGEENSPRGGGENSPRAADPERRDETAPPSSQALAIPPKTPAWGVGEGWLAEYERMAVRVAGSVILPDGLTDKGRLDVQTIAKNVLAVALAGRELGIGFMEATRQIDVINGATALRAELKMALAKRDGMIVDSIEATDIGCTITAHRKDTGESVTVTFDADDKKQAGLGKSSSGRPTAWDTFPEDMFYARASSRLVRRLMPDARGASFRSTEELTDEPGGEGYGG